MIIKRSLCYMVVNRIYTNAKIYKKIQAGAGSLLHNVAWSLSMLSHLHTNFRRHSLFLLRSLWSRLAWPNICFFSKGQFWCNRITILTVFLSCYSWLTLLISPHSFLFWCYGYLILQSIVSNNQIDTKVTYPDKNWSKKNVTELPHYLPILKIWCTLLKFWEVVGNERKFFF